MMQSNFGYTLYLDNLPSATILRDKVDKELPADYFHGIPIGVYEGNGKIKIYNHWDLIVVVHDTLEGHHRIVGFEVEPYSLAEGPNRESNNPSDHLENQYLKAGEEFTFSYRIITRVSNSFSLSNHFSAIQQHHGQCEWTITLKLRIMIFTWPTSSTL
jgi:hypothetical protein